MEQDISAFEVREKRENEEFAARTAAHKAARAASQLHLKQQSLALLTASAPSSSGSSSAVAAGHHNGSDSDEDGSVATTTMKNVHDVGVGGRKKARLYKTVDGA
eukprot:scaffold256966_cov22-Tisochrysis_lutea.AAC.1